MDLPNNKISAKTLERVQIAKSYIEKKYKLKKESEEQKKQEWDKITRKMEEMRLNDNEKEMVKSEIIKKGSELLRMSRKKMSIKDFESVAIIGRGAFGEVRVCKEKMSGQIVAIKKMRKEDMYQKNQVMHVRTEREILISNNNPWVVNLKYSFQDDYYLYLAMEFLPGGDLMSLLIKRDVFKEEEAKFYIAELVLAVDTLHSIGCIHRDLKPDNILIDKQGHIKLSDFGLSKLSEKCVYPLSSILAEKEENKETTDHIENTKLDSPPRKNILQLLKKPSSNKKFISEEEAKKRKKDRTLAYSTVGTPDYIAPEVFGQTGYGPEVDWWSVGIILYEMLVGFPPFFSENPADTCQKIVQWRKYFSIPPDSSLSVEAENLIRKLIAPAETRLGHNGVDEIKYHPFFFGVDWKNIRKSKAPFVPQISSDFDSRYFDKFEEQEPFYPNEKKAKKPIKDVCFLDYSFQRDLEKMKKAGLNGAMELLEIAKQKKKERDHLNEALKLPEQNQTSKGNVKEDIRDKNKLLEESSQSKNSVQNNQNKSHNVQSKLRLMELKNEDRTGKVERDENQKSKISASPDSKVDTNSNSSSQGVKLSSKAQFQSNKNLNVIPLIKKEVPQALKSQFKEKVFLSPRFEVGRQATPIENFMLKETMPVSAKNVNSNRITFETNKYTNKLYEYIKQDNKIKSPSPTNRDVTSINMTSKSSNYINKANNIS